MTEYDKLIKAMTSQFEMNDFKLGVDKYNIFELAGYIYQEAAKLFDLVSKIPLKEKNTTSEIEKKTVDIANLSVMIFNEINKHNTHI